MRSLTVDINVIDPREGDQFGFEVTNDGLPLIFTQSGQVDSNGWNKTYVSDTQEVVPANRIIKLNTDLSYRPESATFSKYGNGVIEDFTINNAGAITSVGSFTLYNGLLMNRINRITETGGYTIYGSGASLPINAIVENADGSMYVGGSFTNFNGSTVNRFCKILANGSNDTTFNNTIMNAATNKGFNGMVNCIAVQSDGKILVGGSFTKFNNVNVGRIVRLNTNGTRDTSFNIGTGFNLDVTRITIQPDGKILVGGSFTTFGAFTNVNGLIRLQSNGSNDGTFSFGGFNVGFNQYAIRAIHVLPSGDILVGGDFTLYKGNTRNGIVKINSTGTVDYNIFGTGVADIVNVRRVYDIKTLSTGEILIGGFFQSFNGQPRNNFVKLNADGSFHVDKIEFNDPVKKIIVKGSFIYVAGQFTNATIGTTAVSNLYNIPIAATNSRTEKVYATYDNLVQYNTNPYGITYSIIFGTVSSYTGSTPDYSDVICLSAEESLGAFADKIDNTKTYLATSQFNNDNIGGVRRITATGSIDTTFNTIPPSNYFYQLDNGKIISYTGDDGLSKFNYDGTLDTIILGLTSSYSALISNNDYTYVYSQQSSNNYSIIRYNNNNVLLSSTFSEVKINNTNVFLPAGLQNDGRLILYAGGSTCSIYAGGLTYSNRPKSIYRFNLNGTLDTTFSGPTYSINDYIHKPLILSNNKIIVSEFNPVSPIYSRVRRYNSNGSLDITFSLESNIYILYTPLYEQNDGKVIILSYNYNSYINKLLRINTDGTIDNTYNGFTYNSSIGEFVKNVAHYNNDDMLLYMGIVNATTNSSIVPPIKLDKDGNFITNGINFIETIPIAEPECIFVIQPDDKAIIYNSSGFSGTASTLIRINPNGTIDNTFDTSVLNTAEIKYMYIQSDNKILINTPSSKNRLNVDGSEDLSFNTTVLSDTTFISQLQNGDIYYVFDNLTITKTDSNGVYYTTYGLTSSSYTTIGVVENLTSPFNSIAKQSDDKLLFSISATASIIAKGGTFSKGTGIHRLNTDGSFDSTFNYSAGGLIPGGTFNNSILKVLPDNRILFIADNYKLRKLNTNGTLDTSFAYNFESGSNITSIDVTVDNRLIIGGDLVYFGDDVHLMWLDINNGDVLTWLGTDQLTGYVFTKNYSNGDILAIGNSTWPEFIATGNETITRIDKDANEVFYLDTPVNQSYQPTGVRMQYTFDNDEVVLNDLYDTPNYVELTYTNTSLTINDLIQEVVVRSPHLIISTQSYFDTANYKIRVWEGSIFDGASQSVAYDITKQKLFLGQSNVYININNLVREKLEANVGNFFSTDYDMAKPLGENMSKWVQVDETLTNVGATVSTSKYRLFATDGYLYNEEIQGVPNILLTGNERYIYKDQIQRIYFQTNFLTRIQFRVEDGFADYDAYWNVDLLGDNKNYVQSLTVDTRNFPFGNNWAEYQFDYSTGETEIVRFNIYDYCKYQPFYLVFKNKWGVLESIGLTKKSTERLDTTNTKFERSILDYNGSYDINRHTKKQFNVTGEETWTLNTDWMPEYMNQALEEVNLSEEVWLVDSNNTPYPVTIEDNSIDYKTEINDKLIQYTIKVKLSHSIIKNII